MKAGDLRTHHHDSQDGESDEEVDTEDLDNG